LAALADWLASLLQQGLSLEDIARCISMGIVCGLFPVFGTTTVLCVLAAQVFGLSHALIQVINYGLYPLYPFSTFGLLYVGRRLLARSDPPLTREGLRKLRRQGVVAAVRALGLTLLGAVIAWVVLAPPLYLLLTIALKPLIALFLAESN
jgi:hypothetical protein